MEVWRELSSAIRGIARYPVTSVIAVITLAMGMGVTVTAFTITNSVLFRPLDYQGADRLAAVWKKSTRGAEISYQTLSIWNESARTIEHVAILQQSRSNVSGPEGMLPVSIGSVSPDFFSVFRVYVQQGRTFNASEERGGSPVALISEAFRKRVSGVAPASDTPSTLVVQGASYVVIGVIESGSLFQSIDVWIPLLSNTGPSNLNFSGPAFALLRSGTSVTQARSELQTLATATSRSADERFTVTVEPLKDVAVGSAKRGLHIILVAAGVVFLLACCNAICLLLARAISRWGDTALRFALGAKVVAIVRQFAAESLLLALAGGALAFLGAYSTIEITATQLPTNLPRKHEISADLSTFLFTVAMIIVATILCAFASTVVSLRTDSSWLVRARHNTGVGKSQLHLLRGFVALEACLAGTLLVGCGLLVNSLVRLQYADVGFETRDLLILRAASANRSTPQGQGVYVEMLETVRALPGVECAAGLTDFPLLGTTIKGVIPATGDPATYIVINRSAITEEYFRTMGIRLIRGREFSRDDTSATDRVVIVSRSLATKLWGESNSVGRWIALGPGDAEAMVVGIVDDVRRRGLVGYEETVEPHLYVPLRQDQASPATQIVARLYSARSDSIPQIRALLRREGFRDALIDIRPAESLTEDILAPQRRFAFLASFLGASAFLLCGVGIFGVVDYAVRMSTRDLAIRAALGASPFQVRIWVLRTGLVPVAVGLLVSVVLALQLGPFLGSFLYGVRPHDAANLCLGSWASCVCGTPGLLHRFATDNKI